MCGIILRLSVYFYNKSFWLDETFLGANLIERNYLQLFAPLDYGQASPPFFMIISKFLLDLSNMAGNITARDLILRILPCFSSIVSLPLFLCLVCKMFKNKYLIMVSFAIFSFSSAAICYTQEFKQYSTELMTGIILLIAFYSIDLKKNSTKQIIGYSAVFCLAPWFSYSSLFILASGFLVILTDIIKEKNFDCKNLRAVFLPFFISSALFYFLHYRMISKVNFDFMHEFWKNTSFFTFGNFAELFGAQMQSLISFPTLKYLILFIILSTALFVYNRNIKRSILLILPVVLCILASFFECYPYERRLILFLLPIFAIIYSSFVFLLKRNTKTLLIISIVLICTSIGMFEHSPRRKIAYEQPNRNFFKILKEENPEFTNVIAYGFPYKYYLSIDRNTKDMVCDHPVRDFDKKEIIDKLNEIKTGEIGWIYMVYNSSKCNFSPELKKFILNNQNLNVEKIVEDTNNENVYLIKFKKIK